MNIELHEDAVLLKQIDIQEEEKTASGLILMGTKNKINLYEVVAVGNNVNKLDIGTVVRAKENIGERINIKEKEFLYFPYGESCYYYILKS